MGVEMETYFRISFVLPILLCNFLVSASADQPCHYHMSVNITHGHSFSNGSIYADDIIYESDQYYEYESEDIAKHIRGCICLIKNCARKCCGIGEVYVGKKCTESDDASVNPFSPPVYNGIQLQSSLEADIHFGYVFGDPCTEGKYVLNSTADPSNAFYLQQNGDIIVPENSISYSPMNYCLEIFLDGNKTTLLPLVCFKEETESASVSEKLFAIGMLISVPLLLVTSLVYLCVSELRSAHGAALSAYAGSLAVAFALLAMLKLQAESFDGSAEICVALPFVIQYMFMSSYFWLSSMCIDIWWTFSSRVGWGAGRGRRRFLWYALLSWGAPLLLSAITALMQFAVDARDGLIRPEFAVNKCWFRETKAEFVYFYLPMAFPMILNLVLFSHTTFKIVSIQRETAILKGKESARHAQYNKDKQRFVLYFKLFVVMGVNWMAELISFFASDLGYFWILTDVANCSVGIFIFFIFVWKKKVKNLLIKKYNSIRNRGNANSAATRSRASHTDESRLTNTTLTTEDNLLPLRAHASKTN